MGEEIIADAVGAGEVALSFGLLALGDERFDLGVRRAGGPESRDEVGVGLIEAVFAFGPIQGPSGKFGVAVLEHGEDLVKLG